MSADLTVDIIEHLDDATTILNYINRRFNDAMNLSQKMSDLFNDEAARERAFGAPGEKGDPERPTHLATRLNNVYEQFLDLAAGLRGASVPSQISEVARVGRSIYGFAGEKEPGDSWTNMSRRRICYLRTTRPEGHCV